MLRKFGFGGIRICAMGSYALLTRAYRSELSRIRKLHIRVFELLMSLPVAEFVLDLNYPRMVRENGSAPIGTDNVIRGEMKKIIDVLFIHTHCVLSMGCGKRHIIQIWRLEIVLIMIERPISIRMRITVWYVIVLQNPKALSVSFWWWGSLQLVSL